MINENGFYRPTYAEIVASKEQKAKELFGEDIETGELTPLGKFIRINAYDLSKAYEDLEATYYARFPNTASGTSLDRLCVFAGISRNPAKAAQHNIRVYSTEEDYVIDMGELIVCGSDSDITFYNINSYTCDQQTTIESETYYYADVIVECAIAGTVGNVTLTDIVNPITEIAFFTYISMEEAGEEMESDVELRKRFSVAVEGAGSNNANAIRAGILRVAGVTFADIIENENNTADADSRPPHSFECYVSGGTGKEQEIGEAIFNKKPIGIKACSTATGANKVTVTVQDEGGNSHTIYFSKVTNVAIKLSIKYKKNAKFGVNGQTEIRNNLAEYINGLGVGVSVILSKLYEHIYDVVGVTEVTELKVSTDGGTTWTTNNVTIQKSQTATITADSTNIILTEVTS